MTFSSLRLCFLLITQFCTCASERVYRVATSEEFCPEIESDEYCITWEYYQKNQTLFSQSNTEWRFMSGIHHAQSGIIAFLKVRNVTIRGVSDNCGLYCNGSNLCQLLFVNSSDVQISNITVIYPNKFLPMVSVKVFNNTFNISKKLVCFASKASNTPFAPYNYDHCVYSRAWIFVNVANLNIENIRFEGYQTHWAIVYSQIQGFLNVKNVHFAKMAPWNERITFKSRAESRHHIMIVLHPWSWYTSSLQWHLWLSLEEISFSGPTVINHRSDKTTIVPAAIHVICDTQWEKEGKVNITMHKIQCLNVPLLQVHSINNPGLRIVLENSTALMDRTLPKDNSFLVYPALSIFLRDRDSTKCKNESKYVIINPFHVEIEGVIVERFVSNIGPGVLHVVENYCKPSLKGVFLLKESQFIDNIGLNFGGIFYAEYIRYNRSDSENSSNYKIVLRHNIFIENTVNHKENVRCKNVAYSPNIQLFHSSRQCQVTHSNFINGYYPNQREMSRGVVTLSGFKSFGRVIYQANVIKESKGNAICLNDTDLQLQMPPELEYYI